MRDAGGVRVFPHPDPVPVSLFRQPQPLFSVYKYREYTIFVIPALTLCRFYLICEEIQHIPNQLFAPGRSGCSSLLHNQEYVRHAQLS